MNDRGTIKLFPFSRAKQHPRLAVTILARGLRKRDGYEKKRGMGLETKPEWVWRPNRDGFGDQTGMEMKKNGGMGLETKPLLGKRGGFFYRKRGEDVAIAEILPSAIEAIALINQVNTNKS